MKLTKNQIYIILAKIFLI